MDLSENKMEAKHSEYNSQTIHIKKYNPTFQNMQREALNRTL